MKSLNAFFVIAALLIGTAASATSLDPRPQPIDAFLASAEVVKAIDELKAQGFVLVDEPIGIVLSGSCGVAGCSNEILVSVTVRTAGSNTQTKSVLAVVTYPTVGKVKVELAELK